MGDLIVELATDKIEPSASERDAFVLLYGNEETTEDEDTTKRKYQHPMEEDMPSPATLWNIVQPLLYILGMFAILTFPPFHQYITTTLCPALGKMPLVTWAITILALAIWTFFVLNLDCIKGYV